MGDGTCRDRLFAYLVALHADRPDLAAHLPAGDSIAYRLELGWNGRLSSGIRPWAAKTRHSVLRLGLSSYRSDSSQLSRLKEAYDGVAGACNKGSIAEFESHAAAFRDVLQSVDAGAVRRLNASSLLDSWSEDLDTWIALRAKSEPKRTTLAKGAESIRTDPAELGRFYDGGSREQRMIVQSEGRLHPPERQFEPGPITHFEGDDEALNERLQDASKDQIRCCREGRRLLSEIKDFPNIMIPDKLPGNVAGRYDYDERTIWLNPKMSRQVVESIHRERGVDTAAKCGDIGQPQLLRACLRDDTALLREFIGRADSTIVHELTHVRQNERQPPFNPSVEEAAGGNWGTYPLEVELEAFDTANRYFTERTVREGASIAQKSDPWTQTQRDEWLAWMEDRKLYYIRLRARYDGKAAFVEQIASETETRLEELKRQGPQLALLRDTCLRSPLASALLDPWTEKKDACESEYGIEEADRQRELYRAQGRRDHLESEKRVWSGFSRTNDPEWARLSLIAASRRSIHIATRPDGNPKYALQELNRSYRHISAYGLSADIERIDLNETCRVITSAFVRKIESMRASNASDALLRQALEFKRLASEMKIPNSLELDGLIRSLGLRRRR